MTEITRKQQAARDSDKTVLTKDCPDLSDFCNPIQKTLQIIKDQRETLEKKEAPPSQEFSATKVKPVDPDEGEETRHIDHQ